MISRKGVVSMSREIKFRAWHKNIKEMCQNVETNFLYKDYLEFMQYTGLHDKTKWDELTENEQREWKLFNGDKNQEDFQGKEIYEGDIVSMGDGNISTLVFWDNDNCAFKFKNLKRNELHDIDKYSLRFLKEVIGNIYENPELLKEA